MAKGDHAKHQTRRQATASHGEADDAGDDLIIESLSSDALDAPAESSGSTATYRRSGAARRVRDAALRGLWRWRRTQRGRWLSRAAVATLLILTVFVLLGGPAFTIQTWQRLAFALRSGTRAPQLAMTSWATIPAPPDAAPGVPLTYSPEPGTPQSVFACQASPAGVTVWRTYSNGARWLRQPTFPLRADTCQVKIALDASSRVLLVARVRDRVQVGCEQITLLYSTASGYSWTPAPTPAEPPTICHGDAWLSSRWIFFWGTDALGLQPSSTLLRSGDGGQSWQVVDGGLPEQGAYLAPALTNWGSNGQLLAQVYYWPRHGRLNITRQLWRSTDGGASWSYTARALPGATLLASTDPQSSLAGDHLVLYAPVYPDAELAPPWTPDMPPSQVGALSRVGGAWSSLPPLPLGEFPGSGSQPGAPLGLNSVLGVGPSGALVTLGADPHGDTSGASNARDLWLWVWDPAASEWRLGLRAPANATLSGFTWSSGPVGSPYTGSYGMYLWLTAPGAHGETLYSAFIPNKLSIF